MDYGHTLIDDFLLLDKRIKKKGTPVDIMIPEKFG
jgi:hypothetical protein